MDIKQFEPWLERRICETETLALPLVRRLAAALDREPGGFDEGGTLPLGWHAVLFAPVVPTHELGPDGHPPTGDLLPPLPLPRRLFAGRRLVFRSPLRIGQVVTRRSQVSAIRQVDGKSGTLVFVTVRNTLTGPDGTVVVIEEQDIAYREAVGNATGAAGPAASTAEHQPSGEGWMVTKQFGPCALFRFSAAVFNAHRIHYDADFAREVEGYEGLIVNASLMTLHMLNEAASRTDLRVSSIAVRNKALVMADQPVAICGLQIGAELTVQAVQSGRVCVDMQLALA